MKRTLLWMATVATLLIAGAALAQSGVASPQGAGAGHESAQVGGPMDAGADMVEGADDLDSDLFAVLMGGGEPAGDDHGHGGDGGMRMHGGGMGHMGGGMPGGNFHGMMASLDLTDAQRAKLEAIHDRQARKGIQSRADLQLAGLDLHKLMRADKPDQRQIDTQIDRMASLRATQQKSAIASLLEARAVLTPEQQAKLKEQHMRGARGMGKEDSSVPGGGQREH